MNNLLAKDNERDIIERIKKSRLPVKAEPIEPTAEVINIDDSIEESVPDEVEEVEALAETLETEPEGDDEETVTKTEDEEFYVDIDGREISFKQIQEWEQGNLRQSDYTKKTQALADGNKQLKADKEALTAKNTSLDSNIAELEVLVGEKQDSIDWDELREYDPGEYLKQKELQDKRKKALKNAKSSKSQTSKEEVQALATSELSKLIQNNPSWIKDGQETEAYKSDMANVQKYLTNLGYTEEMQQGILTAGHGQVFIDAAKFHTNKQTNAKIAKKVRKAPVVTKPGGVSKGQNTVALEKAIARHKKEGSPHSAFALRKAQKLFKGI